MKTKTLTYAALIGVSCQVAFAASLSAKVHVHHPLAIVFTPLDPTIDCGAPVGTFVTTISTTGGNGNPVAYTLSGATGYALSGATIVVDVGMSCGVDDIVTITATQP